MATTTLDRIAQIVDTLAPLGATSPGAPLRSADWNTLVEAVLELARVARSREQSVESVLEARFAPREHTHEGLADMSWFDAATRARLEGRVDNESEWRRELRELRGDFEGLKRTLDDTRAELAELRRGLDKLEDSDFTRAASFKRIETQFGSLTDLERDMTGLNTRFQLVGDRVAQALELRDRLVDDAGAPIDLVGLRSRVESLDTLRDNLKTASGALGTYREVEKRLERLEVDRVGRAEIDVAVRNRLADGTALADAFASSTLLATTLGRVDEKLAPLSTKIDSLASESASTRVKFDASEALLGALRERVATAEAQVTRVPSLVSAVDGLNVRVAAVDSRTQNHALEIAKLTPLRARLDLIDSRLSIFEPLPGRVSALTTAFEASTAELTKLGPLAARVDAVESFDARISGAQARLDALDTLAAKHDDSLTKVRSDVSLLSAESGARDSRLLRLESDVSRHDSRLVDFSTRIDRVDRVTPSGPGGGSIFIDRTGGITRPLG